jgi:cell division septation protein DedD
MRTLIRLLSAALLGVTAAVLVSCGSSGSGLIPSANAGPLQSDFEAVAREAASGNGSCARTESALGKTEQDFLALPATVDRGLHKRLQEGIANLHTQALALCLQPATTATSTTGAQTTTTPSTTTTTTETTPTTTPSTTTTTPTSTQTTPTTTTPPSQGGGTEAPGEGSGERGAGAGAGRENGAGAGNGGSNAGGASAGGGR